MTNSVKKSTSIVDDVELADKTDNPVVAEVSIETEKVIHTLSEENKSLKDNNLRLLAEMENIKRRSAREVNNAHKYALDGFAKNLLEVSDSLEMGIRATESDEVNVKSIIEGLKLTKKVFLSTLEKHGIEMVGTVSEKFDPEKHEAISMVASEEDEKDTILELAQTGWNLNDRLLRPAMVIIGT